MTPSKMVPTMVVPTMMALRTIRTLRRFGGAHCPGTIPFIDQNCCGSHIIWSNRNIGFETFDELQHLGTFRMKPPYRFGTNEDDPLAKEYTKLDPQVLVIASSLMAGQGGGHHFLSPLHAEIVSRTDVTVFNLGDIVNIDSWRKIAPLPYETMRSAADAQSSWVFVCWALSFDRPATCYGISTCPQPCCG